MACKVKRTPTNAEREQLRKENEQRVTKMKVGKTRKEGRTEPDKGKEDETKKTR